MNELNTTSPSKPTHFEEQTWQFEFYGDAREYFKIWIVNIFLTIITLSIYAPWAKVRRLRYFYGNTELAGQVFDFTAIPTRILVGRAIAMVLFVGVSFVAEVSPEYYWLAMLLLFAVMPWLLRSTMRFRARNTKFGNSRFYFSATLGETYAMALKGALATMLSFGLLYPLALYWFKSYQINHLHIGDLQMELKSKIGDFYAAVLLPYFIMIGVVFVVGIAVGIIGGALGGATGGASGETIGQGLFAVIGLMYVVMLGLFVPLTQGYLFKTTWQKVELGNSLITSELNPWTFAWIKFTNYLAMICTLGLLRPWAEVRLYRYQADTMNVVLRDNPDDLLNMAQEDSHSIGEEMSDVFDLDLSL